MSPPAHASPSPARASTPAYSKDLSAFEYRRLHVEHPGEVDFVAGTLGTLDILVNNAGTVFPGGKSEYEPDVFEEAVRINLVGAYRMAHACHDSSPQAGSPAARA